MMKRRSGLLTLAVLIGVAGVSLSPSSLAARFAGFASARTGVQKELTASGRAPGQDFGWSVALSGSTAVVGAPFRNSSKGAAYVFVRSRGKWSQQAKLTIPNATAGDQFGWSVGLQGSTVVVGAPGKNSKTGAAYVFVRSGGKWSREAVFTASDAALGDLFGFHMALSGSTVVVGAPGKNSKTGAAYVFVRSRGKWSEQAKLTAADAASGAFFSNEVAVSGSTAVVGSEDANSAAGAAYVFVRSHSKWSQQAEFKGRRGGRGALGDSVAVSGSTAVVGEELINSKTGRAYVFVRSGGRWSRQAKLTASDHASGDQFGFSVAISGSTAVVSAATKNSLTGAVYVFARSRGKWSQQAELTAKHAATSQLFGAQVAIDGLTAIAGAPFENSRTGAAYPFVRSHAKWTQQARLTATQAAAGD